VTPWQERVQEDLSVVRLFDIELYSACYQKGDSKAFLTLLIDILTIIKDLSLHAIMKFLLQVIWQAFEVVYLR
jgi:hypothetical protein